MTERRKPKYLYEIREVLRGEAIYEVVATSKKEALGMLSDGRHGNMVESGVDHMGRGVVTRIERVDDDMPLGGGHNA